MKDRKLIGNRKSIEKREPTENRMMTGIWNLAVSFFCLFLLLMAVFYALRDGLKIDWWNMGEMAAICGVTAFLVTLAYSNRVLTVVGLGLGTVLEVCLLYFRQGQLWQEFLTCYDHAILMINSYYRTNYEVQEFSATGDSRVLLLFLIPLLGLWIGVGVTYGKKLFLTMFPLIPAFVCGFLLGYAPGLYAVFCLLGGLGIRLLSTKKGETKTKQKASRLAFLCLCAAAGITGLFYRSAAEKLLVQHEPLLAFQLAQEDKMLAVIEENDFLSDLLWKFSGGETRAGLTNQPPQLSTKEIFSITVENYPDEPIYVKDFTGAYYDNGVWYPAAEEEFEEFAASQGRAAQEYGGDILSLFYNMYVEINSVNNAYAEKWPENVTIKIKKRTGNQSLFPYYANLPDNMEVVGDSGIRMQKEKSYQFQSCSFSSISNMNTVSISEWNRSKKTQWKKYGEYTDYANDMYTRVPTQQLSRLADNWEQAIESILSECSYSFDLEPVPEGQDIVEYFIFEQKKGYCMHFASAYTLLLRMSGHPARYASGYLVLPKDFKMNEDGTYTAVVTGQRAHAWTEYYNYSFGWMPIETTPRAYYNGLQNTESGESVEELVANLEQEDLLEDQEIEELVKKEEEEQSVKEPLKQGAETQGQEQSGEAKNDENSGITGNGTMQNVSGSHWLRQMLQKALGIVFVTAGIILMILLRRKMIWKHRNRRFADDDTKRAAESIVTETLKLLKLSGIILHGQEDELDFAKKTEAALACFEDREFVEFIEIARTARYGNDRITEGQIKYLHMIYRRLVNYEKKRMNWLQRVWYRYGQVRIL